MKISGRGPPDCTDRMRANAADQAPRECSLVPWRLTHDCLVGETVDGKIQGDKISRTIAHGRSSLAI